MKLIVSLMMFFIGFQIAVGGDLIDKKKIVFNKKNIIRYSGIGVILMLVFIFSQMIR